jgi:adenine-specific DNA-methyltransferase
MASLIPLDSGGPLTLLDPGAGVGSLSAAVIDRALHATTPPRSVHVIAYEIDSVMLHGLEGTLAACKAAASEVGMDVTWSIRPSDFLEDAAHHLLDPQNDFPWAAVDAVIMNPPYLKIGMTSRHRRAARALGVETTNLYAAFLAAGLVALKPHGNMVAITPRSFCNGTYFRPLRDFLLSRAAVDRLHVFASRSKTFRDNSVLQETLISHFIVGGRQRDVLVTESDDPATSTADRRPFVQVVHSDDPQRFIHLPSTEREIETASKMASLSANLADLGLNVSTGRVVDFRATQWLHDDPGKGTVPLLYPHHLRKGYVSWPLPGLRKPNAIFRCEDSESLLIPMGDYVLVKRFTSKEERRRVTATWLRSSDLDVQSVGLENHLNYFHADGKSLDPHLAAGLTCYLNSSLVDEYFRTFSGHTQVNAGDLRSLRYPTRDQLITLGATQKTAALDTAKVDHALHQLGI